MQIPQDKEIEVMKKQIEIYLRSYFSIVGTDLNNCSHTKNIHSIYFHDFNMAVTSRKK